MFTGRAGILDDQERVHFPAHDLYTSRRRQTRVRQLAQGDLLAPLSFRNYLSIFMYILIIYYLFKGDLLVGLRRVLLLRDGTRRGRTWLADCELIHLALLWIL